MFRMRKRSQRQCRHMPSLWETAQSTRILGQNIFVSVLRVQYLHARLGRMEAVRIDDASRWTQHGGFIIFLVRWQRNNGASCFADTSISNDWASCQPLIAHDCSDAPAD